MRRLLGTLLVVLVLPACSTQDEPEPGAGAPVEPVATTAPPGLEEVPPGYDQQPDGPPPPRDEDLDDAALTALLRTRASAAAADGHCTRDQVRIALEGYDSSLGHRYSRLVVRNTSAQSCVVEGVPGIGVRGAWGSRFVPEVKHTDRGLDGEEVPAEPLRLEPGETASAGLEWTGDLAGAESEPASMLVVQLAQGQVPAAVPAVAGGGPVDIGQFTTIVLAPFAPAP